MLTSKQRAFLRKQAMMKDPELHLGKDALKETCLVEMDQLLRTRELVKTAVLKNCDEEVREMAEEMAEALGADVVQVVGRRFVLYRHSRELAKKGRAIVLPR